MSDSESKLVENLLAKPDVHLQWAGGYRTPDNERFFEAAFDLVADVLKPPPGATVLDVGCGSCAHSVRLARRGFNVRAVDFSESALKMAAAHLREQGLEDRVTLGRENILQLSFPDESFDYVVCWGVLMHIPDVGRAVSELARVVRPGGHLVISEGNMHSMEATALRVVKRLFGQEKAEVKRTPAGVEFWKASGDDALVTRQADVGWLARAFGGHGLRLVHRAAGQLSEAYAMAVPAPLKKAVHGVNNFWFRSVREPRLAYGNILFFRKTK